MFSNRGRLVLAMAMAVALLSAAPLLAMLVEVAGLSPSGWGNLWTSRIPELLGNTLTLAVLVAAGSLFLGVVSAWLVTAREFVGRRWISWLCLVPLAVPTYVYAYVLDQLTAPGGWLAHLGSQLLGYSWTPQGLYGLAGATLVLTLAGFPYVFLLARSALQNYDRALEETATVLGASRWRIFWTVLVPGIRPALFASTALVVLHVLADFGTVSLLRFQTFTLAIYQQITGRLDYAAGAALSLVLVTLTLIFLVIEQWARGRRRYQQRRGSRQGLKLRRGHWRSRLAIHLWFFVLLGTSVILPLVALSVWSLEVTAAADWDASKFIGYTLNSVQAAVFAATVAVLLALPVAWRRWRHPDWLSGLTQQIASLGFVLPGPVVAVGVLVLMITVFEPLYGSMAALVLALAIRFLPLSIQTEEATLQQCSPGLLESARVLGHGPFRAFIKAIAPLLSGGLAAAWVLVFIEALKELPATLILRPIGFDTLPIRIWLEASEEMLQLAAPAALLLIAASLPAIWILERWQTNGE